MADVVTEDLASARVHQDDPWPWTPGYQVLYDQSVMRTFPSKCQITINIITQLILLYNRISLLSDQNALLKILINLIHQNQRKCLLGHLNPTLSIEGNQMILYDLGGIILPFNQNTMFFIRNNGNIFLNFS